MTTSDFLKLTPQQKAEGVFIRGNKQDGLWCRWYSNGQIEIQCHYKNGKYNGEVKWYYPNGQILRHCTYKNGDLDGEYTRYYENGQICDHYIYKDGRMVEDLL